MSTEVLVFGDRAERSHEIAEKLRPLITHVGDDLLVVPWQDHYLLRDLILWMKTALLVLYGLILFIASLVIVNTMLMAVLERTHEMGVMMAMGMKGRDLVTLFLAEAAFIALVGGLLGGALGSGLSIYAEAVGLDFSQMLGEVEAPIPYLQDYTIYPDFTLSALGLGILFGLIMALVATILPCQKAARLVPTEAIRKT
jgi:putative ABC transport system permease protein